MKIYKSSFLLALYILLSTFCSAQTNITFGSVVYKNSQEPIPEATISIPEIRIITSTDGNGKFSFVGADAGTYEAKISTDGFNEFIVRITVGEGSNTLPPIELNVEKAAIDVFVNDISAMSLEDASSSEDGGSISAGQNVSSVLNAARDPFLSAATFGWGQFFYRIRGYDNDQNVLFLNGIPMNDLEEGGVFYNSYSGLNDVFRGRSMTLGLQPNDYTFGGYGLNTYIDASASAQRAQTRISYASTNRNYRNRLMATHSSGLNKNGWAYSFSVSKRWAEQGPIKGTFYDAYGYYMAIEKKYKNHDIGFVVVGAPIERGKNGPSTTEASSLAGTTYYNPYWGYQTQADGSRAMRNSRVFKSFAPLYILTHKWDIDAKTKLTTALGYQSGETYTTTFDWYNSADPRPDYYRYLPSWEGIDRKDPALEEKLRNIVSSNPDKYLQVDWNRMYQANRYDTQSGDGRASYILGSDVEASQKINANINLQHIANDHITFNTGLVYQGQKNHNFRRIEDMLGAKYWLNINQFAERTFRADPNMSQTDLNNPDERKVLGDEYGYNYNVYFNSLAFFTQAVFKYNRFDFFVSNEIGNRTFYREGLYKSGLFPTNSYGKADEQNFSTHRSKAGLTYKFNGRNYFYANGAIGTQAPIFDNVYVSARTRNQTISNPQLERIRSAEIGYLFRSPNFKARITCYATDVKDASDVRRYYNGDDRSFVNIALQNINKQFTGLEFGAEIKLSPAFTLNLAGNLGQAFYTSRPNIDIFVDNEPDQTSFTQVGITEYDTAYIKNYNLSTGPQTALQANLFYRSPKYWFGSLTANYLANKWIDIAPTGRSVGALDGLDKESDVYKELVTQIKVQPFMTFDAFFGKSFKVDKYISKASNQTYLFVNLGLSNMLNKQDIVLYGFENLRVDPEISRAFRPKYAYTLGFQYFFNISFTF